MNHQNQLTVLSFGAGQDSSFILYMIITFGWFRKKYVKGKLIVIFSDTGNEHQHTYTHLEYIKNLCIQYKIEFYILSKSKYHPNTWKTLDHQYKKNKNIMSMMFPRSCTDNLKIKPIYNFLDHYIGRKFYQYKSRKRPKGKHFIKRYAIDHGKINVLIGIASDEERRISKDNSNEPIWFRNSIKKVYPLITEGVNRQDIHDQHKNVLNLKLPFPSNCLKCPFISKIELLWLYRFETAVYYDWVNDELEKIKKYEGKSIKNLGVKGEKLLPQILEEAIQEFGHMTDEELTEYKMSHGHCVMSSY